MSVSEESRIVEAKTLDEVSKHEKEFAYETRLDVSVRSLRLHMRS